MQQIDDEMNLRLGAILAAGEDLWSGFRAYNRAYLEMAQMCIRDRDDILQRLEAGQIDLQDLPAKLLFGQLLQNTHEGFFSDPQHGGNRGLVGWKLVGFPGARADFMDWADRGEKYPFPPVAISGERG